jgi:hypothetical protein
VEGDAPRRRPGVRARGGQLIDGGLRFIISPFFFFPFTRCVVTDSRVRPYLSCSRGLNLRLGSFAMLSRCSIIFRNGITPVRGSVLLVQ